MKKTIIALTLAIVSINAQADTSLEKIPMSKEQCLVAIWNYRVATIIESIPQCSNINNGMAEKLLNGFQEKKCNELATNDEIRAKMDNADAYIAKLNDAEFCISGSAKMIYDAGEFSLHPRL
jgi:hypothetical protein